MMHGQKNIKLLHIVCVCVCNVSYPPAKRMFYYAQSPVACPTLPHFFHIIS